MADGACVIVSLVAPDDVVRFSDRVSFLKPAKYIKPTVRQTRRTKMLQEAVDPPDSFGTVMGRAVCSPLIGRAVSSLFIFHAPEGSFVVASARRNLPCLACRKRAAFVRSEAVNSTLPFVSMSMALVLYDLVTATHRVLVEISSTAVCDSRTKLWNCLQGQRSWRSGTRQTVLRQRASAAVEHLGSNDKEESNWVDAANGTEAVGIAAVKELESGNKEASKQSGKRGTRH